MKIKMAAAYLAVQQEKSGTKTARPAGLGLYKDYTD